MLVTKGGLVFQGGGSGFLNAYDSQSGNSVWSADVRTGIIAPPVTYAVEGEQYVAVLAGDGGAGNFIRDNFGEYEGKIAAIKYGNRGRLFAFKIGGTRAMPDIDPKDLLIPEQPVIDVSVAGIKAGEELYANFCATCHGAGVRGRTIADLRYMTDASHAAFDQIVLYGMRVNDGMGGFADILSEEDARHLHAYIVDTAIRDRLAQQ